MEIFDPLEKAEHVLKEVHESTRRHFRPAYRRYPTLFLFLITFSLAALFHGLDRFMDYFSIFEEHPLILVLIGVIGLFVTGNLYKRLGKDKFEE